MVKKMYEPPDLVDIVKKMYTNKEYQVTEDNSLFIINNVIYTINSEFLKRLYKPDSRIDGVYQ